VRIRELTSDDLPFLREMLYAALAWRPSPELPPFETVIDHPQLAIFHAGWGREGDAGLVAEEGDRRIGAVWWRFFTDAVHGEGFVDEATPELAIAVVPSARGKGIGSALLDALLARARADGYPSISLSVDRNNARAIELYERHGFARVDEDADSVTMLAPLDTQQTTEGTDTA